MSERREVGTFAVGALFGAVVTFCFMWAFVEGSREDVPDTRDPEIVCITRCGAMSRAVLKDMPDGGKRCTCLRGAQ